MPRFSPYRRASQGWRGVSLFLLGPLLWLAALVLLAVVVHLTNMILIGALIAFGAFLLGLVGLAIVRSRRIAEERDASAPR
jgi:hypothetical protein